MIAKAALTVAMLACAGMAQAQDGAEFFNGKTVTYVVATEPGGGYDTNGRLVAEFMQKHLPGSTFAVRNMPGAGHIIGANYIYGSEPDGLTIGTFNTGLIYGQIVGDPGIRFDLTKYSWVGNIASDPRVIVTSAQSSIKDFESLQALDEPIRFGGGGVTSAATVETILLARALDLKIDVITGYNGNETEMAMRRGEIMGVLNPRSSREVFVNDSHGQFLLQFGGKNADVPQARDVITDPAAQSALSLIEVQGTIARLTAAPPGVPADRLAALQDAYLAATRDPEFLERAAALRLPVEPRIGDEVGHAISAALDQPEDVTNMLKAALLR